MSHPARLPRPTARCSVCFREIAVKRSGQLAPHGRRGTRCPGHAVIATLTKGGIGSPARAAKDAHAVNPLLHVDQTRMTRRLSVGFTKDRSGKELEVRAASHFQNPATSLAITIRRALTAPALAPVLVYDAAGQLVARIDPLTRVRTPVGP